MDTGVGLTLRLGVPDREGDVRLIGHVHRAVGGGHAGTWDQLRGQRVVVFEVIDRPQAVHIDGALLAVGNIGGTQHPYTPHQPVGEVCRGRNSVFHVLPAHPVHIHVAGIGRGGQLDAHPGAVAVAVDPAADGLGLTLQVQLPNGAGLAGDGAGEGLGGKVVVHPQGTVAAFDVPLVVIDGHPGVAAPVPQAAVGAVEVAPLPARVAEVLFKVIEEHRQLADLHRQGEGVVLVGDLQFAGTLGVGGGKGAVGGHGAQ